MRALLLLSTILIAGCSSATEPASSLRVTTTVSAETLRVGDAITVTVTVKNIGNSPVTIPANDCPEHFEITKLDGSVVGPGVRLCSAVATPRVLQPGDQATFAEPWSGDALPAAAYGPNRPMAPGQYYVRARFFPMDLQRPPALIQVVQ